MFDLDFDFGFDEDVSLLRAQVSRFAAEHIAPRAAEIDTGNAFPRDLWPALGELGLFGITVDPDLGGAGLGYLAHVVVIEEISRASASVGLSYAVQSNLCVNQLALWGTEEQKRRFLPGLLSGAHVGALAMSEPNAGSDVMAMRTAAVPDGDGYVLDGTKTWITNGPEADLMIVYARDVRDPKAAAAAQASKIKAFIVEKSMPGFRAEMKLDKLGMRGSDTSGIAFTDCRIPATHVLPGDGKAILMSGLDIERLVLAGGPLGI